jgi:hypothetical protein
MVRLVCAFSAEMHADVPFLSSLSLLFSLSLSLSPCLSLSFSLSILSALSLKKSSNERADPSRLLVRICWQAVYRLLTHALQAHVFLQPYLAALGTGSQTPAFLQWIHTVMAVPPPP